MQTKHPEEEPKADIENVNIDNINMKIANKMERKRRSALLREMKQAEKELLEEEKPHLTKKHPKPPGGTPKLPGNKRRRR